MEALSRKAEKEKLAELEAMLADATLSGDMTGKLSFDPTFDALYALYYCYCCRLLCLLLYNVSMIETLQHANSYEAREPYGTASSSYLLLLVVLFATFDHSRYPFPAVVSTIYRRRNLYFDFPFRAF